MILETERLFLREMRLNDFQDLAEILQNPNVMYAYEHDFSDKDKVYSIIGSLTLVFLFIFKKPFV